MAGSIRSKIRRMGRRWSALLDRNVKVIRTVDFGLGLACAGIAWTSGGDMSLVTPALIAGFIFAAIGIRSIPDMTKLWKMASTLGVAVVYIGIGGFLYWHFKPKPVEAVPVAVPAPKPTPTPAGPPKPRLASNYSRMVLVCDSPKSTKAESLAKRKEEFAERIDLAQKIFGVSIKGNVTETELTMSMTVNSATGMFNQNWLIKRSGDQLYVSITNQLAEANAMSFLFAVASLAPIDPNEDYAKQMQEKVEQITHAEHGKCKFL